VVKNIEDGGGRAFERVSSRRSLFHRRSRWWCGERSMGKLLPTYRDTDSIGEESFEGDRHDGGI